MAKNIDHMDAVPLPPAGPGDVFTTACAYCTIAQATRSTASRSALRDGGAAGDNALAADFPSGAAMAWVSRTPRNTSSASIRVSRTIFVVVPTSPQRWSTRFTRSVAAISPRRF